jgi:4-diphosphocytidyl-2-C-methyl-D-erythritol kinase
VARPSAARPGTARPVTVRVPAKVNLQLSVGAVRPDGYHDLVTVFQAVGLYDEVTAEPTTDGVTVTVEGEGAGRLPTDERNLAVRAARSLAETVGVSADVHLRLRKQIPVAGGMAGGSADAAATLLACDGLWGLHLDVGELSSLAAGLGADVPFALAGGTAVGVGTGTQLTSALARGSFHWVLALADTGLETAQVYEAHDRLESGTFRPEPRVSDDLMGALRSGDPTRVGAALSNDLEAAALSLRPQLSFTLEVGREMGAVGAVVSGSGPTCAFLATDEEHAVELAVGLSAAGVCRTVRRAVGPVPGARVVDAVSAR